MTRVPSNGETDHLQTLQSSPLQGTTMLKIYWLSSRTELLLWDCRGLGQLLNWHAVSLWKYPQLAQFSGFITLNNKLTTWVDFM